MKLSAKYYIIILIITHSLFSQLTNSFTYSQTSRPDEFSESLESGNYYSLIRMGLMSHVSAEYQAYQSYQANQSILNNSIFAVGMISGFHFTDFLRGGFGIEYNNYPDATTYLPLFLDLRINILPFSLSPYLLLEGGYSLAWVKGKDGLTGDGIFANIGGGIEYTFQNSKSIFFELTFRYQQSRNEINFEFLGFNFSQNLSISNYYITFMAGFGF